MHPGSPLSCRTFISSASLATLAAASTADRQPKATGLAHTWKANYHDARGLLKFAEHFGKR